MLGHVRFYRRLHDLLQALMFMLELVVVLPIVRHTHCAIDYACLKVLGQFLLLLLLLLLNEGAGAFVLDVTGLKLEMGKDRGG